MAVSLECIQSQLKAIQTELREMKFAADVDRRNSASQYNNLVAEVGNLIGRLDTKVEFGFEAVNERIDRLEGRIDRLEGKVDAGFARIEQLLKKD
jgi:predicted nuclease with TOPRIM domain